MVVQFTLQDLFGRVPANCELGEVTISIIVHMLKHGVKQAQQQVADQTGASLRQVKRTLPIWREEVKALLEDAQQLGYSGSDLANMVTLPSGDEYTRGFISKLRALRTSRREESMGNLLSEEFIASVDALWREYREAKAYQGYSPDEFEVKPPRWFIEEELGLGVGGSNYLMSAGGQLKIVARS